MPLSTIKPAGGGDYTSLAAWATAKAGNAGTEDAQCFVGNCGAVTITTWTPSSSTISADPAAQHNGVDNGTTGLTFTSNISIQAGLGWTVRGMLSTNRIRYAASPAGNPTVLFEQNLIVTSSTPSNPMQMTLLPTGATVTATYTARNNVIIIKPGSTTTIAVLFEVDAELALDTFLLLLSAYNNTIITSAGTATGVSFQAIQIAPGLQAELDVTFTNNAVFDFTTCISTSTVGAGVIPIIQFNTNASSDGTAGSFGGSGNKTSQSSAAWFTSPPSNDTLKTGSPGINAGTTIGSFSNDIINTTRPQGSAWDIGAFEFIASGGGIIGGGVGIIIGD